MNVYAYLESYCLQERGHFQSEFQSDREENLYITPHKMLLFFFLNEALTVVTEYFQRSDLFNAGRIHGNENHQMTPISENRLRNIQPVILNRSG